MAEQTVRGRVLRAVGGFYRVACDDGVIHECKLSGRLKPKGASGRRGPVLPGDLVILERFESSLIVKEVLPRTSQLIRPAVANVSICVVVQSMTSPAPNLELIDRILIQAKRESLEAIVCFTKVDLVDASEVTDLLRPYAQAGFQTFPTSAKTGQGISELASTLTNVISILAGPSGVGKSRLLNALCPTFQRQTGEVSAKLERGKHTTRQVELLPIPQGGWVADSPGFSVLEFADMRIRELPLLYPEFNQLDASCRFYNCLHRGEPNCAVETAVSEGSIDYGRYQRYLRFVKEIEENEQYRY